MDNFDLKKFITEGHLLKENLQHPEWYDSFLQQLCDKFGVDKEDLPFKMVDAHLMGVDSTGFSQNGLNYFPKAVRSILKQPEFAGKAVMVWDNTGKIEDKLIEKHPHLEDHLLDEEYFWVYIE